MTVKTLVFAGSLSRPSPYFAAANGKGIAVFAFDEATGALNWLADTVDTPNPTYLTALPERRTLYVTSEVFGELEGSIHAYRIDPPSGTLTALGSRQPTRGSLTAYCQSDRQGKCLFVANYAHETPDEVPGRHVVSFSIQSDGSLTAAISEFVHHGSGSRPDRQSVPHPHCVVPSPDNRFAFVADLGCDEIVAYRLDAASARLTQSNAPPLRLAPGSGPRHLIFHPRGTTAYVINELSSTVCRLGYASESGTLSLLQSVGGDSTEAAPGYGADLLVSADGRFLYATFRGDSSVMTYELDASSGEILSATRRDSGGKTPRSFTLSPCGKFMLVANQDSDTLVSWRLDLETGQPVEQADIVSVGTPMCVTAARLA